MDTLKVFLILAFVDPKTIGTSSKYFLILTLFFGCFLVFFLAFVNPGHMDTLKVFLIWIFLIVFLVLVNSYSQFYQDVSIFNFIRMSVFFCIGIINFIFSICYFQIITICPFNVLICYLMGCICLLMGCICLLMGYICLLMGFICYEKNHSLL